MSSLVWGTIGVISIRFRRAWTAQGRALADLPCQQPLYPILPIETVILAVLMFAAQGYSAVVAEPFSPQNVVATYIGLAIYILCYVGYWVYDRFWPAGNRVHRVHLVPLMEMDLDTDAVWGQGGGARMREKEAAERTQRD
ncbi:uncharacterized protein TRAVEDRAFT_26868, partial [Trametes versicolor FP-101664 SS1]|uniref:uncharacterized protein n=1 Tax=Trametes versicolor (strain FP-101664) TaxID=717944 RepID=UPI00046231A9